MKSVNYIKERIIGSSDRLNIVQCGRAECSIHLSFLDILFHLFFWYARKRSQLNDIFHGIV